MGLKNLPIMHQASKFTCCWRKVFRVKTYDLVNSLGCSKVMTNRANAAKPLNQYRRFPIRVSLDESFKAPELHYVKKRIFHLPVFIQVYRNSSMAFHPRYRINSYFSLHNIF